MKNIQLIQSDKYDNNPRYEHVEGNIYRDTQRKNTFLFGISYELEEGEDSQYPLEDILDKYLLHVWDLGDSENFHTARNPSIELGGKLENIQLAISEIIGKRVFNSEYIEDGKTYIGLKIE